MIIIVDSDGLIGTLSKDDLHYAAAHTALESLSKQEAKLIYPATVIAESTTTLQIRLKRPELAIQILKFLTEGLLIIESVDEQTLNQAALLLKPSKSKHNTLFDGIVMAIAQKYKADAIFSFDKFYKSKGFKLASEL